MSDLREKVRRGPHEASRRGRLHFTMLVRVEPEVYAAIAAMADSQGWTVSQAARVLLDHAIADLSPEAVGERG